MNLPAHIITCSPPSMNLLAHSTTSSDPSIASLLKRNSHKFILQCNAWRVLAARRNQRKSPGGTPLPPSARSVQSHCWRSPTWRTIPRHHAPRSSGTCLELLPLGEHQQAVRRHASSILLLVLAPSNGMLFNLISLQQERLPLIIVPNSINHTLQ